MENNTGDIYYYIHDWIYYKEKGMKRIQKMTEIELCKLEKVMFMMKK